MGSAKASTPQLVRRRKAESTLCPSPKSSRSLGEHFQPGLSFLGDNGRRFLGIKPGFARWTGTHSVHNGSFAASRMDDLPALFFQ